MKIAIIKYNAGNLFSVDCALKRLGVEPVITNDKETLLSADKVIFPGVGEARTTMDYLKACHMDATHQRAQTTSIRYLPGDAVALPTFGRR